MNFQQIARFDNLESQCQKYRKEAEALSVDLAEAKLQLEKRTRQVEVISAMADSNDREFMEMKTLYQQQLQDLQAKLESISKCYELLYWGQSFPVWYGLLLRGMNVFYLCVCVCSMGQWLELMLG